MCFLSVSALSQGTQMPGRSCDVIISLKSKPEKKTKKKPQPQVLLGRGSVNLPQCRARIRRRHLSSRPGPGPERSWGRTMSPAWDNGEGP